MFSVSFKRMKLSSEDDNKSIFSSIRLSKEREVLRRSSSLCSWALVRDEKLSMSAKKIRISYA